MTRLRFSAVVLFSLFSAAAAAQGYDGLIADPAPAARDATAPAAGGYSGLIPPAAAVPSVQGYSGVIPGAVPAPPAAAKTPDAAKPAPASAVIAPPQPVSPAAGGKDTVQRAAPGVKVDFTPIPAPPAPAGMSKSALAQDEKNLQMSADRLRALATSSGYKIDYDNIPPEIAESMKISGRLYAGGAAPSPRIEGMLPAEFLVKKQIDYIMSRVNDTKLPEPQRRQAAQDGYKQLLLYADGLTTQKSVPDAVYKRMGVPPTFVKEQIEAADKGLARLEEAFKVLRDWQ